jgi:Mg-chelatase subunit ChlD
MERLREETEQRRVRGAAAHREQKIKRIERLTAGGRTPLHLALPSKARACLYVLRSAGNPTLGRHQLP